MTELILYLPSAVWRRSSPKTVNLYMASLAILLVQREWFNDVYFNGDSADRSQSAGPNLERSADDRLSSLETPSQCSVHIAHGVGTADEVQVFPDTQLVRLILQQHSTCVFLTKYNESCTKFVDAASHPSNVIQYTSQVGCKINCGSHGSRTLAKVNHRETLGVFASRSRRRNSESYAGLHNTPKEDCRKSRVRTRNFVQRLTHLGRGMFPPRPPSNFKMATQKSTRQEISMRKTNVDIVVKFHFFRKLVPNNPESHMDQIRADTAPCINDMLKLKELARTFGTRGHKCGPTCQPQIKCWATEQIDPVVKKGVPENTDIAEQIINHNSIVDTLETHPWYRNDVIEKGYSFKNVQTWDIIVSGERKQHNVRPAETPAPTSRSLSSMLMREAPRFCSVNWHHQTTARKFFNVSRSVDSAALRVG